MDTTSLTQVPHPPPLKLKGKLQNPWARFRFQLPERAFKIPKSILTESRRLQKKRYRRKIDAVYDPKKVTLEYLPDDILYMVFKELDTPSRIALGLTSKLFAKMSSVMLKPQLKNNPSVVRFHKKCLTPICPLTLHISSRRIFMLQIKTWMPRGYRLCWVCCKYSKVGSSEWHFSTRVRLTGKGQLDLPAIREQNVTKVWCHHACLPGGAVNGRQFGDWAWNTHGASGGFGRWTGLFDEIRLSPELYTSGF